MKRVMMIALVLCCVIAGKAFSEYSTDDLLKMTVNSLKADRASDTASVRGVGRITQNDSTGIFLARRAAISDAQRGLLILKRSLEEKRPPRMDSVSGHVPGLRVKAENVSDDLYFVEAEVSLSELLGHKARNYAPDDEEEDEEDYDEDDYDDAEEYDL
ncbi:MAG: hypothetical protein IJS28_05895 [Synergistaceae bacterium]|nr:hypothetical protein [Synergistaceae bacterium]